MFKFMSLYLLSDVLFCFLWSCFAFSCVLLLVVVFCFMLSCFSFSFSVLLFVVVFCSQLSCFAFSCRVFLFVVVFCDWPLWFPICHRHLPTVAEWFSPNTPGCSATLSPRKPPHRSFQMHTYHWILIRGIAKSLSLSFFQSLSSILSLSLYSVSTSALNPSLAPPCSERQAKTLHPSLCCYFSFHCTHAGLMKCGWALWWLDPIYHWLWV